MPGCWLGGVSAFAFTFVECSSDDEYETADGEVSTEIQNIAGLDFPIYIWAGFRGQGAYWHNWVQGRPGFFVLDLHPCEPARVDRALNKTATDIA